jgi:inorganic triphosphatase YgiF
MPQETELKLAVCPQDLQRLLAHPLLAAQAARSELLGNTYFDTPDLALMRQRIAVRERRQGGRTLLTVKTAGHSTGGLSRRKEWEALTSPGCFDFAALVDDAGLARQLQAWAADLVPVFQTDFLRRSWLLTLEDAVVEVALDEGSISSLSRPHVPSEPILELELELKQGPETALMALADALSQEGSDALPLQLRPSDRSKAERGYVLFLKGDQSTPDQTAAAPDKGC